MALFHCVIMWQSTETARELSPVPCPEGTDPSPEGSTLTAPRRACLLMPSLWGVQTSTFNSGGGQAHSVCNVTQTGLPRKKREVHGHRRAIDVHGHGPKYTAMPDLLGVLGSPRGAVRLQCPPQDGVLRVRVPHSHCVIRPLHPCCFPEMEREYFQVLSPLRTGLPLPPLTVTGQQRALGWSPVGEPGPEVTLAPLASRPPKSVLDPRPKVTSRSPCRTVNRLANPLWF
ncbi:hypothetical protein HJG60_011668 [Phyllostomus discolor]|uniref:Uncharacterized protein n=1 Tax=Phyllostomus discolor TaxID=89673 RepID=A0A834E3D0_9CHIR|nr:hypothetical protein HJG60_011668 [Phyllostomus discolor]